MSNPFKSKKVVYATAYLLVSFALALMPSFLLWVGADVDPSTISMIESNMPYAFTVALFVIGGHTLSDAVSMARGYQKPYEAGEVED